jgi:hypothetical protein
VDSFPKKQAVFQLPGAFHGALFFYDNKIQKSNRRRRGICVGLAAWNTGVCFICNLFVPRLHLEGAFQRRLANKILHVNAGKITSYVGGYDYFLDKTGALDDERAALTAG